MLDDAVPIEDLVEYLQSPPTINHVVLGDDFKPVDDGFLGEDVIVVGDTQAYPHAIIAKSIKTIGWHYKLRNGKNLTVSRRLERDSSPQSGKILNCLRRLGAVGSAATLALAVILTGILAAALSLAIILTFTGVFGLVSRWCILGHEKHASP
jgi:hypothetical protein